MGLLRPILYCNVHVANESTKRLTNSRTMNVPEVSEFLPASALQSILMDFKLRGKSTAMLNDALEGLDMKTVHMMSFCPTRMFYILTKCEQTVANFVLIYDVIATANLKLEKNAAFRSPKKWYSTSATWSWVNFLKYFPKLLDKCNSLIKSLYHTSLDLIQLP